MEPSVRKDRRLFRVASGANAEKGIKRISSAVDGSRDTAAIIEPPMGDERGASLSVFQIKINNRHSSIVNPSAFPGHLAARAD
jgi:hypothetical protein